MKQATCRAALAAIIITFLLTHVPAQERTPAPAPTKFDELAAQLLAARTDGERESLLAENVGLLTKELRRALITRANRFYYQGDSAQALKANLLAQTIAERSGDRAGVGAALTNVGVIHLDQGSYKEALRCFNGSLEIWKELGLKEYIADSTNKIGAVYQKQGDYALSLEYFTSGLNLRESLGNGQRVAESLHNIGEIHYLRGDYGQALDHFRRSFDLREASAGGGADASNRFAQAQTLHDIGLVYEGQGNYSKALEFYDRSIQFKKRAGIQLGVESTLNNIGQIHEAQGNYYLALEYYRESLNLSKTLGHRALHAQALNSLGRVYASQGDYELALRHHRESLALAQEMGNKALTARTLNLIGAVFVARRDPAQALDYYRRSLEIAEAMSNRAGVAETLNSMAAVRYELKEREEASRLAARAADIARQVGSREALWHALTVGGRAEYALGQTAAARKALDEAISVVETMRADVAGGEQQRQGFFEDKVSPYQAMVGLLVEAGEVGAALSYAERAKARVLLDVLQSGRADVAKALTPEERRRERELEGESVALNKQVYEESARRQPDAALLAQLRARLEKTRLNYEDFRTGIYNAHPELKTQRGEMQPLTQEEAAGLLGGGGTALVEFVVTEGKTLLFVLTAGGERARAPDLRAYALDVRQQDLQRRVEDFRQRLAGRDLNFRVPARGLYELLLGPAREQLRGRDSLVIVPDGPLWELPFQALQPAAERYLLEECAISYAPSLTVLREVARLRLKLAAKSRGPESLLAFGNPLTVRGAAPATRRDEALGPLPEAEREVLALGRLYGAARSRVFVGAEAREERLKQEVSGYRILHMATHGILNDAAPMYSQIVLSPPGREAREDGLLESWEVMGLDLQADLVVLSACETARGRYSAGEGMIGLTWALFVAGTPGAVVSQWKVESTSTTELMLEFHRLFKSRDARGRTTQPAARALRQAALALMRNPRYRHPFYWAGFVMVGDAG